MISRGLSVPFPFHVVLLALLIKKLSGSVVARRESSFSRASYIHGRGEPNVLPQRDGKALEGGARKMRLPHKTGARSAAERWEKQRERRWEEQKERESERSPC
jgi:hypothetical protein